MSKSPWGKIGDWAAEAERADAEEREAAEKAALAKPEHSFPSLKEAVTTATKQKKKTKMTLHEFTLSGSAASRGLTREEMLLLPTGPKDRSPEEMQCGRLGGGFSNYGTRQGSNQGRSREYDSQRSYGFQDEERRRPLSQGRVSEVDQPSRADGVDNWSSMKKQIVPEYNPVQTRPGGTYSILGGGGGPGVASRADGVDNWASVRKPISQEKSRSSSFGSGFSRPETDRWTRNEQRSVFSSPKNDAEVVVKVNKPNPFGAARPREDVLAEKGLDWRKLDVGNEGKKQQHSVSGGSRPSSSHSSRPETPISSRSEVAAVPVQGVDESGVKHKQKVNPFGDAKPREILLEEKGFDWKKIDLELEHRRVERPETEEEKNLKEEIQLLKQELLQKSSDEQTSINDVILRKEHELELLVRHLDDNVSYSQKIFERQRSAGRGSDINDRPPSRPGVYEEPRAGCNERPHSRSGTYDDPRAGSYDRPSSHGGVYEDPRVGYSEKPSRPVAYEDPPRSGFGQRFRSKHGVYEEPRSSFTQRSSFTSGTYQEPRSANYNERHRSRGTVNLHRPSDDRRPIQGGVGKGFFGSRDTDRSGSRW